MPKVSVIIPNYNHERFLALRISSVLSQTYQDFELIILDDCSTDDSKEIIEKFRDNKKVSKIIYNETNSGTTFKQWKKGIEQATGEYIWIAESDDYASPEFLETLIKPFLKYHDLVISFCRSVNVDDNNRVLGLTLHADKLDAKKWTVDYVEDASIEIANYLKYRNTIPNASAVLFKKPENLKTLLPTEMKFTGDWLFWKNLLNKRSGKIAYSQMPLNFFRTHAKTTRDLTTKSTIEIELKRFKEYKTFVPKFYFNFMDDRYRWMMAEWIDRGVPELVKHSRYRFIPELHPALIARYYLYTLKRLFKKLSTTSHK